MSRSLHSLALAFSSFRGGRPALSRGRRYPHELRARAVLALRRHTAREVAGALGISDPRVVHSWRNQHKSRPRPARPVADFVELQMPAQKASSLAVDVEIIGAGGAQLRLRGVTDVALLRALASVVAGRAVESP